MFFYSKYFKINPIDINKMLLGTKTIKIVKGRNTS